MEEHDGPHEFVLWDGSVWVVVDEDEEGNCVGEGKQIEPSKPLDLSSFATPGRLYKADR
jgi:hypothetical protein